jgi:hypothetical protein
VVPAGRLGIPVVWINRKGIVPMEKSGAEAEVRTLTEFADWLG